jgi:hypothetical protein
VIVRLELTDDLLDAPIDDFHWIGEWDRSRGRGRSAARSPVGGHSGAART